MRRKHWIPLALVMAVIVGVGALVAVRWWRRGGGDAFNLPTTLAPEDWLFSVTEADVLLEYRYAENSPAYCKSPSALIAEFHKAVVEDKVCAANLKPDRGAGNLLEMECVIPSEPPCALFYRGELWAEREPDSTTDYNLRGIGWLVSTCSNGRVYGLDSQTFNDIKRRQGAMLRTLVAPCRDAKT